VAAWDEFLPVLLLGDISSAELPEDLRRRVLSNLEMPPSYSQVLDSLHRAQVYREMYDQARERGRQREPNLFRSLVGTSRAIQHVRQMMQQVADTDASVLILGESGTGKEVVARNLHYHSKRREALRAGQLRGDPGRAAGKRTVRPREGRLYRGDHQPCRAFRAGQRRHAVPRRNRRHAAADAGQAVAVLQERTFERVGSNKTQSVDVRIIAATHKNLESMIEDGTFREDLYYRLNVFPIEMAPLRERVEDIPLLMNELISRMEHEKRGSIRFNSARSCRCAVTAGRATSASWPTWWSAWRSCIRTG
jgi:sigma-54 specific flagellar transcriptional regulator A